MTLRGILFILRSNIFCFQTQRYDKSLCIFSIAKVFHSARNSNLRTLLSANAAANEKFTFSNKNLCQHRVKISDFQ